jgi:hypothetical protein
MKPSEIYEGENSSIHKAFEEVEESMEEYDWLEGALVAISGILETKDPYSIKFTAIKSVLETYRDRILKEERQETSERAIQRNNFIKAELE